METLELNKTKVEAFQGQMINILNNSFLALLVSVGHQTRLFDVLSDLPPSTSEQIAKAAGLNERYVREWLGGLVVGRIIEYDPVLSTYSLPPEHAASLTRKAGPDNLAMPTQYIALVGEVEQKIVECFKKGGGVPSSAYSRFNQLQAEETARVYDLSLINGILPLANGLVERLKSGIRVLDVGCGQGHALNLIAREFPRSSFVGYDVSNEAIDAARAEAKSFGLKNVKFEVSDVARLTEREQFDLITAFEVIHDLAQPTKTLKAIYNALKPHGTFYMQDMAASSNLHENLDHPLGPFFYAASVFYCMTVSLAEGGEGLGTVWGEQKARQKLAEAGFTNVEVKQLPGDFLHLYFVAKKK